MTSRGSDRSPNGHVAGQRLAAHPLPVPSQHRSSTKKHSHRDPKSSKSKATYSRSRLDQDEESDDARCPSDVSMEDGSEETLSKASPSAQADGVGKSTDVDSKSGGPFIGKLQGMIKKEPGYIRWAEEGSDAILIPNDKIFVAKALHKHFGKIKGAEGAGSLWVQKEMPLPDDPIPPDLAQERPPAASVAPRPSAQADLEARMDALQNTLNMVLSMLNASMASRPSGRPDLEARIDELQNTLNTVLSELSANKGYGRAIVRRKWLIASRA
ncbi:hypothetical protein M407DRAFT_33742 [Tulasnella calospora MUT 4182]|uniref:Uncharacterized protein n=1 Tax=Tulasnella calospora MUT 4182 TaxID=1051891 RepID=A0A0C3PQ09_9AGAM|nr:hypothetical protein M407DRAFT_33742 [Tulasnella calospora MUT 4182]